jgi:outer membrane protein assembly factor BamA
VPPSWQSKEYDDAKELATMVVGFGVRNYLQERGYFKALAHDPETQLLGIRDGKEQVLVWVAITAGEQYRLGSLSFRNAVAGNALSIPTTTLREQFRLREKDVFNTAEIRAGMETVKGLYKSRGYPEAVLEPRFDIDDASHRINLTIQITEKPNKRMPRI